MKRRVFAALSLALVSSCTGPADRATDLDIPQWSVADRPSASVGGHDARPEYLLSRVSGLVRFPDGTLVIADQQSSDVRRFGEDGEFLGHLLRRGEGPGEVLGPSSLTRLTDGSVGVLAYRPGFVAVDPINGAVLSSAPFSVWESRVPCGIAEGEGGQLLPTSHVLFVWEDNRGTPGCPSTLEGNWRHEAVVGIVNQETEALDTLEVAAGSERSGQNYRVFGSSLLVAVGEHRIWTGDTGTGVIRAYALDGTPQATIEAPFTPRTLAIGSSWPDDRRYVDGQGVERNLGAYDYPDQLPYFSRIVADSEGHVWVAEYPEPDGPFDSFQTSTLFAPVGLERGVRWRVLDEAGRRLAEVVTPANFFLVQVGADFVVGISVDDLDVQTVHVYPLQRVS